jgi:predicted Ser/Thr protein kinase
VLEPDQLVQGRYRIVRHLREGGMGSVYEVVDTRLGNRVALKRAAVREEDLRQAFRLEARILSALRHPALPVVIDYFSESGQDFLVMDFVDGEDLSELLARSRSPFAVADVLRWADRILDALVYLHERGVVHRDIKPANLKLTPSRDVVLLDFGISKGTPDWQGTHRSILSGGTNGYSPFEQLADLGTDERSDLYALGVTLYQLLTGVLPPDSRNRAKAIVAGKPDPMEPADAVSSDVPRMVAAVLARATALERDDRHSSARDLRDELAAAAGSLPAGPQAPRSRRRIVVDLPSSAAVDAPVAPVAPAAASPARAILPTLVFEGHGRVTAAAVAPDGRTFYSAGQDGVVRMWSVVDGREVGRLAGHAGAVHAVAVSRDGVLLVTGGDDTTVRVWETATGRELARLEAHLAPVRSAAVSRDAASVLTGDASGRAIVWDAASGRGRYRVDEPGALAAVRLSPDGRLALAAGEARSIGIWELDGGREVIRLEGHRQIVYDAAFSPDARLVLSGGGDASVRVHEVASGSEVCRFGGHRSAVRSVAFAPDGATAVSGSIGGVVRCWEVASGRELGRYDGRMGLLGVGTLPPEHALVFAYGADGAVLFRPLRGA